MHFVHQPLTWGFFLVLLPVLIHLINLMRQRRVEWAAMEFLLEAYKKRRNWIWLKQLLLMLSRMLAVALVVAMLAKLVTREQWTSFLGGKATHHYVLLDDSLSMGERLGGGTAFDRAVNATGELVRRMAEGGSPGSTRFTLLRYSQAVESDDADLQEVDPGVATSPKSSDSKQSADRRHGADFNAEVVDVDMDSRWENRQHNLKVSELAIGPEAALDLIAQRISERDDEQSIVYVMSDFRSSTWDAPREIAAELAKIESSGAAVRLVRCVDSQQPNLAITNLRPVDGVYAAGVPFYVEIEVHNFGTEPAEQVPVSLTTIYYPDGSASPRESTGNEETLPDILFDSIPAGQSVVRRTQVFFPTAGQHAVRVELPPDALAGDNRRWCVIDLPASVPVLVIDEDPQRRNADFLASVFQPSQRIVTGVRPLVETSAYLRDIAPADLAKFATVYVLDCESLDSSAMRRLEQFARDGGGVAFFLGPRTDPAFYRDWYDEGAGLFPVPILQQELLEPSIDDTPDLVVEDHPLFRMLLGQRNSFLSRIRVPRYQLTRYNWQPPEQSGIRVIARLRNGQPLIVERPFGRGRVVATLTTLAPMWNTWATQPTFVVFLLELQAYLQQPSANGATDLIVGSPLELVWNEEQYQREVDFSFSATDAEKVTKSRLVEPTAGPLRWGSLTNESAATDRSGLYEAWLTGHDGVASVQRHAVNVDSSESNLSVSSPEQIVENLPTKQLQLLSTADLVASAATPQSFSLAQSLLFGLLALLMLEQLLSYSASYHPARSAVRGTAR